jgi:predicted TIM-barrel fold metal-dependent hydrolase
MKILDTHLHLLYPESLSYAWTKGAPELAVSAHIEDFVALEKSASIVAALMMEADVDAEHIDAEIDLIGEIVARDDNNVIGMIAACRPEHSTADFAAFVDRLASRPYVKGLRRILHQAPDTVSQTDTFAENLNLLGERGYTFDLCLLATQLVKVGLPLVQRCPDLTFVLDHCGVPDIKGGAFEPWRDAMRAMAGQPHVNCKVSGIVAYAAQGWQVDDLRPYFEHVVDCFGWDRLVWGSDWPVCRLGGDLGAWMDATAKLLEGHDASQQSKMLYDNARRIYQLA